MKLDKTLLSKHGVYIIKNKINNKIYIGSTYNKGGFDKRFYHHVNELNNNKHYNYKLQKDWNLYGKDCFEFQIRVICKPSVQLCTRLEQVYLDILLKANEENTKFYKLGYNLSRKSNSPAHNKETLRKIALKNSIPILQYDLNGNFLKEWLSMSDAAREFNVSTNAIMNCIKGKVSSSNNFIWVKKGEDFDINKLVEKKKLTDVCKLKASPIYQYDLSGNFIKKWNRIADAEKHYNSSGIHFAKNTETICKGFQWFSNYKGEKTIPYNELKLSRKNYLTVMQYDKEGNFIHEFINAYEVTRTLKIGQKEVRNCCMGKAKSAGGFIWKYKKDII